MVEGDLKNRTKAFALRVIKLYVALPKSVESQVIGKQLLCSGTSVGAHYREAQRAKSYLDYLSKLESALQKLEESIYWLELIEEVAIFAGERLKPLQHEAEELIAIPVTIVKEVKQKQGKRLKDE